MRHRPARIILAAAVTALVAGACGGDSPPVAEAESAGTEADSTEVAAEPVELQMWLFGEFGYDPLIADYEADHPEVTITTKIAEYNEHHDGLVTALAGGGGPDIAAIEVGMMAQFLARPDNFVNLLDHGADELEGDYLDWKWAQATTPDGSATIGLPTDVGGLAMAYRADLFEEAGLSTDRDEVSASWPTWDAFIEIGQRYNAATGRAFTDESSQIYAAAMNQGDAKYYTPDGGLIYETNPVSQRAWDIATRVSATEGVSADIEPFAEGWNAAMSNGDFAVLTAPAWMMGYIKNQAPDTEGQWDIAAVPEGGGNWGGSHLAIPANAAHPEEAYEFISWLLSPENQLRVFVENGNFPSVPALYDDPAVRDLTDPFFRDAPVGEIYGSSAEALEPIHEGPDEGTIRLAFENALDRVDDGAETPDQAWASAIAEIKRDVG